MDLKPGYKQTEVGIIPEDWRVGRIGEFADVGRGRVISHREISRAHAPLYPVYSSQTSNNGVMGFIDSYDFEGLYVTWTTDGANAGTVFLRDGRFNCTNVCGTIRPKHDDPTYVSKALGRVAHRFVSRNLGNPKLMNNIMKRIPIALPGNVEEQGAIATALSDADALITKLDQLIAKKRDIKQAAMQQLLSGKTRLLGFNGDWEVSRLGDVLEKIVGGGTPSRSIADYWGGDIPWVTVKDFATFSPISAQEWITHEGLKNSASHLIPSGTLITSTRMALGKAVLYDVEVSINQDLKALFPKTSVSTKFLCYWFDNNATVINELGSGSTVKGISLGDLRAVPFSLSSFEEQTAIANVLSDIDNEIVALETRRDKTQALKQGMMQELLTGRIRLPVNPEPSEPVA